MKHRVSEARASNVHTGKNLMPPESSGLLEGCDMAARAPMKYPIHVVTHTKMASLIVPI